MKLKPTSVARVPRVLPPTSPHALCPSIDLITPPSRHLPPPPSFSALSSLPPAPRHPSPTIGHVSTRTQALLHAPVVLFYLARGGGWGGLGCGGFRLDCLVLLMARTPMHQLILLQCCSASQYASRVCFYLPCAAQRELHREA